MTATIHSKANVHIFQQISENLENARTHVAKEVEAADHNQHIMAKLLEQSKYAVLLFATFHSLALCYILFCNQRA